MLVLKYVVTIHIQKQYLRVRWAWTEFCSLFVFTTFFIKHNRSRNSDKARGFMCFVIRYWSDPQLWPHRIYRNAMLNVQSAIWKIGKNGSAPCGAHQWYVIMFLNFPTSDAFIPSFAWDSWFQIPSLKDQFQFVMNTSYVNISSLWR